MFFHVVSVTERYEAFQKNRFDLPSGLGLCGLSFEKLSLDSLSFGQVLVCGLSRGGSQYYV